MDIGQQVEQLHVRYVAVDMVVTIHTRPIRDHHTLQEAIRIEVIMEVETQETEG